MIEALEGLIMFLNHPQNKKQWMSLDKDSFWILFVRIMKIILLYLFIVYFVIYFREVLFYV